MGHGTVLQPRDSASWQLLRVSHACSSSTNLDVHVGCVGRAFRRASCSLRPGCSV